MPAQAIETIVIEGKLDPCGYVFAPEDRAAGGTTLEWAHYRLCQVEQALLNAPSRVYNFFKDELGSLWGHVSDAWTWVEGKASSAITWTKDKLHGLWQAVEDFGNRVGHALGMAWPSMEKYGLWILIGVGALAAIWLTEK